MLSFTPPSLPSDYQSLVLDNNAYSGTIGSSTSYDPCILYISISIFSRRIDELFREIDSFSSQKTEWDGGDYVPISNLIIKKTKDFLKDLNEISLENISDLYPNQHGTISIIWENKNGKLHLEIGNTTYSLYLSKINSEPFYYDGKDLLKDFEIITSKINNLFLPNETFLV